MYITRIILLQILSTIIYLGSTLAQEKLSLNKCLELLSNQNEDVQQSNLNILLAEIKDAKNSFLPTLSLGAGHNYNLGLSFDQIAGQLITGNKWSNNANANMSTRIPIFQNFTLKNKLKQSLLLLENSKVQKEQLLQALKIEVLTKYFEAITNKSLYLVSENQLVFAQTQLEQEKNKYEIGSNTKIDVAQMESSVANAELMTIVNLYSYKNSLTLLKQLIGINLSDSVWLEEPNFDLTNLEYNNTSNNDLDIYIKDAEITIQKASLNLKYAKAAYYPTISFFGGYGTNYSSERTDFITGNYLPFWNQVNQNRNLNFGISLSVPIFDAFKTKNNINKLKIELKTKQSALSKIKTEREKIRILAIQEYHKSVKEYEVLLIQLLAQEKNLSAIKERYDVGVSNAIDYNKALLDFNVSEANVIKSKYTIIFNLETLKILKSN